MPNKLTKEDIQSLSDTLDAICKLVEIYKTNAFKKDGDKIFSETYGQSTKNLFSTKRIRDPHAALVGNAGSLIYGLNEIIDSSDFSIQALEDADINNCSDITVHILNYFLSNNDRKILNTIDSKFDELANKSLSMIQEIQIIILDEQKKTDEKIIQSVSLTEKSAPTFFYPKVKEKEEEHKQVTPPETPTIGPNKS